MRSLLARVQRLEERRSPSSPFERWYGSVEAFTDELRAGIADGSYDPLDMPVVIAAIERWHADGVWAR